MILKKILESIVYSHLWIAVCAAAMVLQTSFLITGSWALTPMVVFTFGSTLFIYSIHRLVGLQKLKDLKTRLNPRYIIIDRGQRMVFGCGIVGAVLAGYCFLLLQSSTQVWLIIPGVISLAYVVPFLSGKKRLRDISLIKIFLIAITYALISVLLVYIENDVHIGRQAIILFIEKALFIFAITIPFDMRDLAIDEVSKVQTLPMLLGWDWSIRVGKAVLLICLGLVWYNGLYLPPLSAKAMMFTYVLASIYFSRIDRSKGDLYYSFGMDGLMVVQTLTLLVFSFV